MHEQEHVFHAPADRRLHLWIEPWAEGLSFPAGSQVALLATSDLEGKIELDEGEDATAVYAWPGCTLCVVVDGEVIRAFDQPVPTGLSAEKVRLLFGAPPAPTDEERERPDGVRKRFFGRS